MEQNILKTIKKYHLLSPGSTTVAAVSGGPDSIAMLHVIRRITRHWDVKIHVAHLNHMFRGEQSEEEAGFVAETAKMLGLSCTIENYDIPSYIKKTGLSPEEAARNIRYSFLRRIAHEMRADSIMTAHHANDQAETVLLHLLRGAGPEGLAAISPLEGDLIRPLLEVTREDILNYCRDNLLEYRSDPSNNDDIYTRNKVRLSLIPQLKKFNPKIINTLVKTAEICRSENDLFHQLTKEAIKKVELIRNKDEVMIDLQKISHFHQAIQRRVVRKIFDDLVGIPGSLSFEHTEELLELQPGKKICLPGHLYGKNEKGKLIISCHQDHPGEEFVYWDPVLLNVPGLTEILQLDLSIFVQVVPWPDFQFSKNQFLNVFHIKILDRPLWIRTRRPGDRFQPKGLRGTMKLKDFFINEKVPREKRRQVPIILSGDQIIWVVGYRTGGQIEVQPGEQKAVVISVKKLRGA